MQESRLTERGRDGVMGRMLRALESRYGSLCKSERRGRQKASFLRGAGRSGGFDDAKWQKSS
jgi:hypothetical protein